MDVKKKRPGRPKKPTIIEERPRLGVVTEPSKKFPRPEDEITVELQYCNPSMFKKIFALLKQFNVKDVNMHFQPDRLLITTLDHTEKNDIVVTVRGARMNMYYCEKPISIQLGAFEIQNVIESINKDFSSINFYLRRKTERSKFSIRLVNFDMDADENYTVDCLHAAPIPAKLTAILEAEAAYPLHFCVKSKFLKRKIQNTAKYSKSISIIKHGSGPITLDCQFETKKGQHSCSFKNEKLIKLKSTIPDGRIFSVSTYIEHIKPISAALISPEIYIAAHEELKLILTAYLDPDISGKNSVEGTETAIVKIFADTIDNRMRV